MADPAGEPRRSYRSARPVDRRCTASAARHRARHGFEREPDLRHRKAAPTTAISAAPVIPCRFNSSAIWAVCLRQATSTAPPAGAGAGRWSPVTGARRSGAIPRRRGLRNRRSRVPRSRLRLPIRHRPIGRRKSDTCSRVPSGRRSAPVLRHFAYQADRGRTRWLRRSGHPGELARGGFIVTNPPHLALNSHRGTCAPAYIKEGKVRLSLPRIGGHLC